MSVINIGTAGWSIASHAAKSFPREGSGLQRYSAIFNVVEINSSFYRSHRQSTWERWQESTPDHFRFSVKMPKSITHEHKLIGCDDLLDRFLGEVQALGQKLAVLLVQLPPKLAFNGHDAARFFKALRSLSATPVACEPRHPSWFAPTAETLLVDHRISRVAADPAICPHASRPGGWSDLNYWRLHGSPVIYRSSYADRLPTFADFMLTSGRKDRQTWCIFDNTASGAAITDALALKARVGSA